MGPLPLAPAIAPLEAWCRRSREALRETWERLEEEEKVEAGVCNWWAKGACCRWCGGGRLWLWWGCVSARSEFGGLVGARVVMAL